MEIDIGFPIKAIINHDWESGSRDPINSRVEITLGGNIIYTKPFVYSRYDPDSEDYLISQVIEEFAEKLRKLLA